MRQLICLGIVGLDSAMPIALQSLRRLRRRSCSLMDKAKGVFSTVSAQSALEHRRAYSSTIRNRNEARY